jgi:hypothetical protein
MAARELIVLNRLSWSASPQKNCRCVAARIFTPFATNPGCPNFSRLPPAFISAIWQRNSGPGSAAVRHLRRSGAAGPSPVSALANDTSRAAPAQRAAHSTGHSGALGCNEGGRATEIGSSAQVHEKTGACAPVHSNTAKRAKGLEPSTFTLAT